MFEFDPPYTILAIVAGLAPVFVVATLGMLVTLVGLMRIGLTISTIALGLAAIAPNG